MHSNIDIYIYIYIYIYINIYMYKILNTLIHSYISYLVFPSFPTKHVVYDGPHLKAVANAPPQRLQDFAAASSQSSVPGTSWVWIRTEKTCS